MTFMLGSTSICLFVVRTLKFIVDKSFRLYHLILWMNLVQTLFSILLLISILGTIRYVDEILNSFIIVIEFMKSKWKSSGCMFTFFEEFQV